MRVENNNVSGQNHDPEQIDLIDLLVQLWRGKMTIIISVIVAIALAIGYLAVAKEKWTSTAIITQPDVGQIAGYNNAMNVIYGQTAPKVSDLQETLIGRFSSAFSALAETLDNQEEPEKLTIEPSVKNQQLPLTVSYVGQTAEGAQMKLAQYIQQVDDKVNQELEKDLKDNIALGRKNLQDSLRTQEVVAQEQKDLRIRQIQEALQYANQAQVTKPQVQQTEDVTQDTLFLLGSEALESMIKHEATRPLVFSPNYYQTRQNLLDIESLKVDDLDIHAYRYVMKPTLPIRRDSPKKAITLILAVLLGGMVGAGIGWGVTLCVITTRSNLFGFKENGQGGDTLPVFLPDATTTSHPLTPQLTDAVYAGSQSPSLSPDPDPATALASDTSSQMLRWSVQSGHAPLLPVRFPRLLRPLSAQCAWCRWHTVWRCRRFPGRQIYVRRAVVPVDTGTATGERCRRSSCWCLCGRSGRWDSPATVTCRCRSPA